MPPDRMLRSILLIKYRALLSRPWRLAKHLPAYASPPCRCICHSYDGFGRLKPMAATRAGPPHNLYLGL